MNHVPRPVNPLQITRRQGQQLRRIVRRTTSSPRLVRRAWMILHRAQGFSQSYTAHKTGVRRSVVGQWEKRFKEGGLAGLADAKGRGRTSRVPAGVKAQILARAVQP